MPSALSEIVPILDLSADANQVAKSCFNACTEHGFFFIANHGIPPDVISANAAAQRSFFNLTLDQKRTILADNNNRGYTLIGDETLDPEHSTQGDNKEGIYFAREIAADSEAAKIPLHGPNQWPDEDALGLPGFRSSIEAYMAAMEELALRLVDIVALSLKLSPATLRKHFKLPMPFLRALHYPAVKSDEENGRFAAGAHSDYGFMTLLWREDPGLQILYKGRWEDVVAPQRGGVFICNIGDMLQRWTGGRFSSTVHRVVNYEGVDHYSCAFFFDPDFDALVSPLPGYEVQGGDDDGGGGGEYAPITCGQFLLNKYAGTHKGYKEKIDLGEAKILI